MNMDVLQTLCFLVFDYEYILIEPYTSFWSYLSQLSIFI